MTVLPGHAAIHLMTRLQDELRTESVRTQTREQFTGAVAVSYTHLDVYKRQVCGNPAESPYPGAEILVRLRHV